MNENKQNTGIKLIVAALVIALTISFVQIGLLNERIDQLQMVCTTNTSSS